MVTTSSLRWMMPEPVRAALREIRLPLKEPFAISSGVTTERRILLLELHDAEGPIAWSECVAGERPNYSAETIDTARLALREWLLPAVLGRRFATARDLFPALESVCRGHPMAKAAIEMAAWALEAERKQMSLASLLGGTRSAVPVGISLGLQDSPEQLADKADAACRQGYRRVKLKIAPGRDVAFVQAVRERVGPEAALSVDANAAYTMDDMQTLRALDQFNLVMIEQPFATTDIRRHALLQAQLATPICLDESIVEVAHVEDMLALGSGRIVNIKPGRVGGFSTALAIHDLCAANSVPVWCGGMLESGIGRAHNVALASLPNFTLPSDLSPSARYWERDIVTPEWTMTADGMVTVPLEKPGLGVTVDIDRVDDLTVAREELAS